MWNPVSWAWRRLMDATDPENDEDTIKLVDPSLYNDQPTEDLMCPHCQSLAEDRSPPYVHVHYITRIIRIQGGSRTHSFEGDVLFVCSCCGAPSIWNITRKPFTLLESSTPLDLDFIRRYSQGFDVRRIDFSGVDKSL